MIIKHLSLVNFKNHFDLDFKFNKNINCFVGNNGAGKTNVLDAIYYLAFCKSFLNVVDTQNISYEKPFFLSNWITFEAINLGMWSLTFLPAKITSGE